MYAHCTRKITNSPKNGAITILAVNNGTVENHVNIKLPSSLKKKKNIIVQSYILTSNSTAVFLNNKELSITDLDNEETFLEPKLNLVRATSHLPCTLPAKSAGFFVIPNARMSICSSSESEMDTCTEEDLASEEVSMQPRFGEDNKNTKTLNDLYKTVEEELEADETYLKKLTPKNQHEKLDWKKLLRDVKAKKPEEQPRKKMFEKPDLKQFLLPGRLGRKQELTKKLLMDELTSQEVEKILLDREKRKEAEKYKLSSAELDEIFASLAKKFKMSRKGKRAINMVLLNAQTKDTDSYEDVSLNNKFKELSAEKPTKKHDLDESALKTSQSKWVPRLFNKITTSTTTGKPRTVSEDSLKFKTALDSFESVDDDLDDHTFYEKLGFTVLKAKPARPSMKEWLEADLNGNNLEEDEYDLNDDVQAFLARNQGVLNKVFYLISCSRLYTELLAGNCKK